ncbi:MAG: hypothetical protein GF315_01095 [candidate division Zixibacteria bacterium]|nr:hypothetical protein [candidate division Zixibacteria bacterium]
MKTEIVYKKQSSIIAACLWMFIISLLLFWLPLIGPLIGGIVGGKKAGNVSRAFLASLLPAIILALMLILATGSFVLPPVAALLGGAVMIVYIVNEFALIAGAIVGGAMA